MEDVVPIVQEGIRDDAAAIDLKGSGSFSDQ